MINQQKILLDAVFLLYFAVNVNEIGNIIFPVQSSLLVFLQQRPSEKTLFVVALSQLQFILAQT